MASGVDAALSRTRASAPERDPRTHACFSPLLSLGSIPRSGFPILVTILILWNESCGPRGMAEVKKKTASGGETETAEPFLPSRISMRGLKQASAICRGCHLYLKATQTVFGEGRLRSRLMFVGEMPGDMEDREGRPFVGPAGRILDTALAEVGISRAEAYVTNVVKHFKWEPKGKRRLHKTPNAAEVRACMPWLEAEIELLKPKVLVALGATAAKSLFGRDFSISLQRGQLLESELAPFVTSTMHPSAILRQRGDADRREEMSRLVQDLRLVERLLHDASDPRSKSVTAANDG